MRSNVQCSINEAHFSQATHSGFPLPLTHFLVEGVGGLIPLVQKYRTIVLHDAWLQIRKIGKMHTVQRFFSCCVYSDERLYMNFKPMAPQLRLNDWVCLRKNQNVYKHVSVIAWLRLAWIISVYLKAQRVRWNRSTKLEVTRHETWLNWWEWVGK